MAKVNIIAGCLGVLVMSIFSFLPVHAQVEGDLRFAGPNSNASQGRVEIYHAGLWGTVCDDAFGGDEAIVVCRQLGFPQAGARVTLQFGPGTGPIWMDDLRCEATGQRLDQCQFTGWNRSDCTHSEDVGVICPTSATTPAPPAVTTTTQAPVVPDTGNCTTPDPSVRLVGPSNRPGLGVVQVFFNNQWGNICDDDWDMSDARVVCRMLCYNPEDALPGTPPFNMGNISEPMMIKSVHCIGTEPSLDNCTQSPWAPNSCTSYEKATVTCIPLDNSAPSKPEPVVECTDGLITTSFSTLRDPYLESKHLTVANTYVGPCNVRFHNGTNYLAISIPFDECGTTRTYNSTHIFYKNIIRYAPTHSTGDVSNRNTYMVHVQCELPRAVTVDKPIQPLTETVTQTAPGNFIVRFHFFRNNTFQVEETVYPLQIPLGEFLAAALSLFEVDKGLRLIVPDCYATPSSNPNDQVRYPLFTNKCPNDPTVGFFPLNNTWFGYRFQTFKFVQFSEVYIHCNAIVCGTDEDSDECDRSCFHSTTTAPGSGRKKRSYSHQVYRVSSPSIVVYDPKDPAEITRPHGTTASAVTETATKGGHSIHASSKGSNLPVSQDVQQPSTMRTNFVTKGGNPSTKQQPTTDNILRAPTTVHSELDEASLPLGSSLVDLNGSSSLNSFVNIPVSVCIALVMILLV